MFDKLVNRLFPNFTDQFKRNLLRELKERAEDIATKQISETAGRVVVKGIDSLVAVAVANLSKRDAEKLVNAYVDVIDDELAELFVAIQAYVPLQLAVEVAKATHGSDSAEANAARSQRKAGIAELKQETRDILNVIAGKDPLD